MYNMYDTVHPSVLAGRRRYRPAVQAVSIFPAVVCFDWVRRKEEASVNVETTERSSRFAVGRANHSILKCRESKNFIASHYIEVIVIKTYTFSELYWENYTLQCS